MKLNNGLWTKRIAGLALLGAIFPLIGTAGPVGLGAGHGAAPPMGKTPGITAPAQSPAGCVDCRKLDTNSGTWRRHSGPEGTKAPQAVNEKKGVTKQNPALSGAAAGESLYMFCVIMCVGTVVSLVLGMIAVYAGTE